MIFKKTLYQVSIFGFHLPANALTAFYASEMPAQSITQKSVALIARDAYQTLELYSVMNTCISRPDVNKSSIYIDIQNDLFERDKELLMATLSDISM